MADWRDDLDPDSREALQHSRMPKWTQPMLASLTDERFSSPHWIFERKLDGERCLAFRRKRRLQLLSRNRQQLNDTYPELVAALACQPAEHYIVDGEIVAFQGNTTSFSRLQGRIGIHDPEQARARGIKVYLYLFDVLHLDHYDITGLALRRRKQLLRRQFDFSDPLRFTVHRNADGQRLYRDACRNGWEGLIAKRADADFDSVRALARDLAAVLAEWHRTTLTVEQRKNKRRGRIYLDVMRNAYGQTSVVPYSVRALSGAPVATPLDLAELGDRRLDPQHWHPKNILRRLGQKHDPWADIARHATGAGRAHRALREIRDH